MADIKCTWTPSFCLLTPVTSLGHDWVVEHLGEVDTLNHPVDHRCIADIVEGARAEGLIVETTN